MAYKINRKVTINGQEKWIRAATEQEYAEKLMALLPVASAPPPSPVKHRFDAYALKWFETYSAPNIATVTATTYRRQISKYLIPAFGQQDIEDITTGDIQKMFNGMGELAKETKAKTKVVLNMILDNAVEDGMIDKNPLKSKRIKIQGKHSTPTATYTVDQMRYLISHIDDISSPQDRAYIALQALHPMRLEEVLGLQWQDIDLDNSIIHIRRVATHPKRNLAEIKEPKTEKSARPLNLSSLAKQYLTPGAPGEFVIGGKTALSYTQVRRMCSRIQRETGFAESITPMRFRTTVLTDLYDQTKDIKATQEAAGHTTSAMTLKHYVKGRTSAAESEYAITQLYTS